MDVGTARHQPLLVHARVARQQEEIPLEAVAPVIVPHRAPADDLAIGVLGPGVGAIERLVLLEAAVLVVGQGTVDLGPVGMHGHPLGPVHGGGAEPGRRLPGEDEHLPLIGEAVLPGQTMLAVHQGQPLAGALELPLPGLEAGHIEGALVQQIPVGGVIARRHLVLRDEAVDVLPPLVIAEVDHGAAILVDGEGRILMLETAKGGALLRGGGGIAGIDFHHPAEAVRLLGMLREIEPLVKFVPTKARILGGQTVAGGALVQRRLALATEVAVEVLLAGEVGAPGGLAIGAVVEGAKGGAPLGIGLGLEQGMARRRAAQCHGGRGGDAAVEGPLGVGLPLAIDAHQLHQGDPVGRLGLGDRLCTEGLAAIREQIFVVGVFVVDGEQGAIRAQGEEAHAVVVVAKLAGLGLGIIALGKGGGIGEEGISPGDQHLGLVAGRHHYGVGHRGGHGLEAKQRPGGGGHGLGHGARGKEGHHAGGAHPFEEATAAETRLDEAVERRLLLAGVVGTVFLVKTAHRLFLVISAQSLRHHGVRPQHGSALLNEDDK